MSLTTLKRTYQHARALHAAGRVRFASSDAARAVARRQLAARLGKLKGIPQKIGQMLSFSWDNDDSGNEFSKLQDSAEPWPVDELLPVIEAAWGRPLEQVLARFDDSGRAASLGQVHRAQLRDGRDVALKIQYPGIQQAIDTDIRQLGWLSMPLGGLNRGFNLDGYRQEILADLHTQLDYRLELRSQAAMVQLASGHPSIVIPAVLPEYSSSNVLTTQWVTGESWDDARSSLTSSQRTELAACLVRLFFEGVLLHGLMQSDWHPGNVRIQRAGAKASWVLYDFGGMCRLTSEQCTPWHGSSSPRAIMANRRIRCSSSSALIPTCSRHCSTSCRHFVRRSSKPFIAEYSYDVAEWNLSERISDILGADRWNFRLAGPASLIPLLRAFHGLTFYLTGLGVPMRWSKLVEPCLSQLRDDVASLALPAASADDRGFAGTARWLKIRVRRAGQTVVELTQPAAAIERLAELLDETLTRRIENGGSCLASIVQDIRRRGYAPGVVFALQDHEKDVSVSLE